MGLLPGFPRVSQLTSITSDGRPSENAQFNCVEASTGACILYYQHKSQWDTSINPDMLKDAAYTEAYRNDGTDAARLVPIFEKLGYKLYPVSGNNAYLVQQTHKLIASGCPVVFTEPDPYSKTPGWSHACVFCGSSAGTLISLDPYIAQFIEKPDSEWQHLLLFGQIWIVAPIHPPTGDELSMLSLTDPIGQHFIEQASGRWHCKETDVDLVYALLSFYRMYGGLLRLPLTNELYLKQYPDTAIQVFEGGIAAYDPKHIIDAPAGAGPVYLLKISEGIGQQIIAKPLLAELQAQVTSLENQLASAKAEVANKPDVSALETELASAKAAFNSIEAVLAQQKGKVY